MQIGGLQRLTLIDFPGKLACTVFLKGCNFRCPWCYSSELVLPEKIKNHPTIEEKEFFEFLADKKRLLEGVVICGGEPCTNKGLPEFIKKIKEMGFEVKLDTNGSNPLMLKKVIPLLDYIAMDIKSFKDYNLAAGIDINIKDIRKSIELIKKSGVDYEFRTTVVPTIHKKEDILDIAKMITGAKRYYLQNFRPEKTLDPSLENVKPYSNEFMLEVVKSVEPFFDICLLR